MNVQQCIDLTESTLLIVRNIFFFVFLSFKQNCRHAVLAVFFPCFTPLFRTIKKKKRPSDYWSVNINIEASFVLLIFN